MSAITRRHGAHAIERPGSDEAALIWSAIADLPQTAALAADEAVAKLSVLPADVASAIAQCEASAARVGASVAISARALSGVLYARVRPVTAAALTTLTAELPGLQWVATTLPDTPRWGAPPQGLDVMRRIRDEFDPLQLLNPGRFLSGV
jgi:glycolate oxidase FAD binding subunit